MYGMLPAALDEDNIETQHALRISFKRLRYAVEVFAPCYGDDFDAVHDTLTAFQDALGDMHDLHVFLDMLRDPDRVESARRAGVTAADLGEVEVLLERRAHRMFGRFSKLAADNPASVLMPALLLPLSRADAVPTGPAASGESEPGAERIAEALAVVRETDIDVEAIVEPMPVAGAVVDFAGMTIEPPVVVGAEPWAVASPITVATPPAAQPATAPTAENDALEAADEPAAPVTAEAAESAEVQG
jgi:hypothetical protein